MAYRKDKHKPQREKGQNCHYYIPLWLSISNIVFLLCSKRGNLGTCGWQERNMKVFGIWTCTCKQKLWLWSGKTVTWIVEKIYNIFWQFHLQPNQYFVLVMILAREAPNSSGYWWTMAEKDAHMVKFSFEIKHWVYICIFRFWVII